MEMSSVFVVDVLGEVEVGTASVDVDTVVSFLSMVVSLSGIIDGVEAVVSFPPVVIIPIVIDGENI